MARRTKTLVIEGDPNLNRDAGKHFLLTEMSAFDAEDWAMRMLLALMRSGTDLPAEAFAGGLPNLIAIGAQVGLQGLTRMSYHEAKPLLDDMMRCVQLMPNPAQPLVLVSGNLMQGQIEEVGTILKIREALLELHTGFSMAAARSQLEEALATAQNSPITRISES